jgi:hypothetical protein
MFGFSKIRGKVGKYTEELLINRQENYLQIHSDKITSYTEAFNKVLIY